MGHIYLALSKRRIEVMEKFQVFSKYLIMTILSTYSPVDSILQVESPHRVAFCLYTALLCCTRRLFRQSALFSVAHLECMALPGVPLYDQERDDIARCVDDVRDTIDHHLHGRRPTSKDGLLVVRPRKLLRWIVCNCNHVILVSSSPFFLSLHPVMSDLSLDQSPVEKAERIARCPG